LFFAP
jgi:hypothetical protein